MSVDDERDRLIDRIGQIQRDLGRFLAESRQHSSPLLDSNLTMRQLKVIMFLAFRESASGQDIAHHLDVGLGTVTGIVDRLIGHGLVTRREDPNDRRVRRVELTPEGHVLLERISEAGIDDFRRLLERLDTRLLHDLCTVLGEIQVTVADLGEDPPR
ncbi:MarR family transcriptional regulator [Planomonospora sp. ID67723]|uniref:MarR family winged helix-turn-helix transcriptional regulator n=1 Tax=Planomonospora sp. ID67723 TaxID=2738134 RepID=UPI0018C3CA85|nr:MarR family transcriptional regulator [Planomonospora sp. ID67723]MBG0831785.1 MarR family transcriptional regulator [Planomonospora sp. ID67723]